MPLHRLPDADKDNDRNRSQDGRPRTGKTSPQGSNQSNRNLRPGGGGGGGSPSRRPRIPAWVIGVLFLALIAYQGYTLFGPNRDAGRTEVLYSVVEDQIRAGNVEEVTILDTRIEADLAREIAYDRERRQLVDATASQEDDESIVRTDRVRAGFLSSVPNPELISLLEQQGVRYDFETEGGSILTNLLLTFLPFLLIVGLIVFMGRQISRGQ